jgi:dihydropyrimidinase/allantoinase
MATTLDLLITGARVVTGLTSEPATLALANGRIAAILDPAARLPAAGIVDASGLYALPGLIDTHVHTRHPGIAEREDFRSGTAAAAAGGITTLFEMPISKVPANSAEGVRRRVAAMTPEAHIDFALYGGASHENLDDIAGQAAGVVAFKTFLQPPPPARLDEFFGLWCTDHAALRGVMAAVAATGLRHCFHCEDTPMFQSLQASLAAAGRCRGRAHADSRPPIVEEMSVAMVLALAAECGGPVGVVHCSSARSAQLVAEARARGLDATAETCPPYLFFTDEALDRIGPFAKCNPPLRSAQGVRALWAAVDAGQIDYIGTDHSPFLEHEKSAAANDIFKAPPGLCGLEVMAPLMLTAVAEGRLSLPRMVDLCSTRAARLFGLARKGRIEVGADADLALVDLDASWTYDSRKALTKSRANMAIYDGFAMRGRVVSTFVRGVRVCHEGEITGLAGHGRFVRPA